MRDYGKVYTRFWTSTELHALSPEAKLFATYLLTSPHTNMIGCFRLPYAYASADLDLGVERLTELMAELEATAFAQYDAVHSWVILPRFLKFNQIENPNQAKAAAALVATIPQASPVAMTLSEAFHEYAPAVAKLLSNGWSKDSRTVKQQFRNKEQEKEQEQEQNQKQEQEAGVGPMAARTVEMEENQPEHFSPTSAIDFPLKEGGHYTISPDKIESWQVAYPELKVDRKLGFMRDWLLANPKKLKSKGELLGWISTWFKRELTDRGLR